jgi:hypothetical protein
MVVAAAEVPIMRMLPIILFGLLVAPAWAAPAWAAMNDADGPVMPDTPSGAGDPAAIVCRAPQPLPGSSATGPKVCVHNSVWLRLTLTGQDLSADGKTVVARPATADPAGDGHPDAVTCRRPTEVSGSRTRHGPEVCLTNQYWKNLATRHERVNGTGQIVSTIPVGPAELSGMPIVAVESSPAL